MSGLKSKHVSGLRLEECWKDMTQQIIANEQWSLDLLMSHISQAKKMGFDSESSGPRLIKQSDPTKLRNFVNMYKASLTGVSFSFGEGKPDFYLPVSHKIGRNAPSEALRDALEASSKVGTIAAHNAAHELLALSEAQDVTDWRWACTQVMMWMTQDFIPVGSLGLKQLIKHWRGIERPDFEETTGGRNINELSPEEAVDYACQDANDALWLWDNHSGKMAKYEGMEDAYWSREMPFVRVIRHMEDTGMAINPEAIERLIQEFEPEFAALNEEWSFLTDGMGDNELMPDGSFKPTKTGSCLNPGSSAQLQLLYNKGLWKTDAVPRKRKSGNFSTESDYIDYQLRVLPSDSLGYALAELRSRRQLLNKLLTTYLAKFTYLSAQYPDNRLHCSFNHTGTATGRISSSYPNLLNIPVRTDDGKRVLEAFCTPDDELMAIVSADFSQIELRILADASREPALMKAYLEDGDVHQTTADMLGISRFDGKTVNFAILYGATWMRIQRLLGVSKKRAKEIYSGYWSGYSKVQGFTQANVKFAYEHGYVEVGDGRIRDVSQWLGSNQKWLRQRGERIVGNTPIQGRASSIIKTAQNELLDFINTENFPARMCNQVYDDLLSYTTKDRAEEYAAVKKEIMESAATLAVPLKTEPEIGSNWKQVK